VSGKPNAASTRNPRASLFAARIKPLPQRVATRSLQRAPIVYVNRIPVSSSQRAAGTPTQRASLAQRTSTDGPRLARIKTSSAFDKKRLATRGVVTITAKSVKLALLAPEAGQAARRQKKTAASHATASRDAASHNRGRKVRGVRVASN
jgi:hypothetical protein